MMKIPALKTDSLIDAHAEHSAQFQLRKKPRTSFFVNVLDLLDAWTDPCF